MTTVKLPVMTRGAITGAVVFDAPEHTITVVGAITLLQKRQTHSQLARAEVIPHASLLLRVDDHATLGTMSINRFMAKQYANPQGWFGRVFMPMRLNRVNQRGNGLVFDLMAVEPVDDVLEVGFGGGELLFRLAQRASRGTVFGVELSTPMLEAARKYAHRRGLAEKITLHEGSVDALPLADASIDCACSVNTVYFWPNLGAGLEEFARVLRPDGRLVLGFGSHTAMRRAGYDQRGFSLYSAEEIESALETAGFEPYQRERLEQPRGAFLVSASRRRS